MTAEFVELTDDRRAYLRSLWKSLFHAERDPRPRYRAKVPDLLRKSIQDTWRYLQPPLGGWADAPEFKLALLEAVRFVGPDRITPPAWYDVETAMDSIYTRFYSGCEDPPLRNLGFGIDRYGPNQTGG